MHPACALSLHKACPALTCVHSLLNKAQEASVLGLAARHALGGAG